MIQVKKYSGDLEPFSKEKVIASIKRIGIPQDMQQQVLSHVESILFDGISTAEIRSHINEFLQKSPQPFMQTRYNLREAIMALGPTGYPFEDYVSKLLEAQGYTTQVRTIVQGTCITHEIDVIAQKNTTLPTKILIEAKFHNQMGIRTDVHVPMYTKSRFEDAKEKNGFTEVWLVTNTKATTEAITYAHCVDMKIISWSYPEGEGLRDVIEKFRLYPVTSLATLTNAQKQKLLENNIVLCRDICDNHTCLEQLSLSKEDTEKVIKEIEFLCKESN